MDAGAHCIAVDVDAALTLTMMDGQSGATGIDEVIDGDGQGSFTAGVFNADGGLYHVRAARRVVPSEEVTSPARRVRVHAAAARGLGARAGESVHLMASLPMKDYFTDANAASTLVELVQRSFEHPTTSADDAMLLPSLKVRVLPRTVAAFMDWAFSPTGLLLDPPQGVSSVVVVDIAHSGTTLAAFDAATQEMVLGSRIELPHGWSEALMALGQALLQKHSLDDLPVRAAINALLKGQYHRRGSVWSCVGPLEAAFAPLAQGSSQVIEQMVHAHTLQKPMLLVCGPGASALGHLLRKSWGDAVTVPEEPEHSNARGMHKFGMLAMAGDL